ncbi:hypothetical protein SB87_gp110 [Parapoxvirus red deer/HL953]|uniref:Uncharacterized protein n=1 Tax=Parapoxvirus red deer/HL953 TaxID=1579460 RepID=A0A0A7MAB8_9POXV|nr:hypothetical protein SB87_gp110 [Parapoxvirus red deer/HL953]AIZ77363.1 hypothetical protein [Parapoxvirus red deer/HL953]
MSHLQILTPFGSIFAPDDERLREIARDLGICLSTRAFGDMLYGALTFSPIPMSELGPYTPECYVAVGGNLIPCSEAFRLRIPIVNIEAAYRTSTGRVILCGKDFNVVNMGGFRPRMRMREIASVAACVEVLELYTEDGQYEFILAPSAQYMTTLLGQTNICLFGSGWCVVDLRRLAVTI